MEPYELRPIFERFFKTRNIEVTEKAQMQILDLINCVVRDPHVTWRPQNDRLENYFEICKEQVFRVLDQITEDHALKKGSYISTMDVVYWVGNNLKKCRYFSEACPLESPLPEEDKITGPGMYTIPFPWNLS